MLRTAVKIASPSARHPVKSFSQLRRFYGSGKLSDDDKYAQIATDEDLQAQCIEEEVSHAKKFLKQLDDFDTYYQIQDEIKNRRTSVLQEPPEIFGDYEYFSQMRVHRDSSYHVLLRKSILPPTKSKSPATEVVFDPLGDKIVPSKYLGTHAIFTNSLSHDQQRCFVVVDIKTDERPTGFIKDIRHQRVFPERLLSVVEGQFNTSGDVLLYIQRDEKLRNSRLLFHRVGTLDDEDVLLYEEPDESVWLGLEVSKCKQFLLLSKVSKRGNELFVARREFEDSAQVRFVQVSSESHPIHDLRFSRTCVLFEARNALFLVDVGRFCEHLDNLHAAQEEGKPVIHRKDANIFEDLDPQLVFQLKEDEVINEKDLFDDSLILYLSKISQMKLLWTRIPADHLMTGGPRKITIDFQEIPITEEYPFGIISPGANMNLVQPNVRFHVDTPFVYNKALDLDTNTGKVSVIEQNTISGKPFNAQDYMIKIVFAPSADKKVSIPITLILRKELLDRNGNLRDPETPSKLLLNSYGCYGLPLTVSFDTGNWSLLERDWIIAFAHVRGGPELGKETWHRQYTKTKKHVTPEDILSCLDFLCQTGLTHPSLICATSDSAGAGMLASAVNLNPQSFQGVHLSVPFLDIKGSLLNPDQPLSKSDYVEFGNPIEDPEALSSISRLCPFTNLRQGTEYPSTLITAFMDDYRTPVWNVLKYTKKFRDSSVNPVNTKSFGEGTKNLAVILDHGSHLGSNDSDSNESRKAIVNSFYELVTGKLNNRRPSKVFASQQNAERLQSLKSVFGKLFNNK